MTRALAVLVAVFALTGCYTNYKPVRGGSPSGVVTPLDQPVASIAGVRPGNLSATSSASVDPQSVVRRFVEDLERTQLFGDIVYPYTAAAKVDADLVLEVGVVVTEKLYTGENVFKAIIRGASLFLLTPVIPQRFGFAVDVSASTQLPDGAFLKQYRHGSEYDLRYTTLMPNSTEMKRWLATTEKDAVRGVIARLYADRAEIAAALASRPAAAHGP